LNSLRGSYYLAQQERVESYAMRLEYSTYEEAKKNFKWSERWEVFDGNRKRFNIAHECVSRHASDEVAIRIKFDDRHKEIYSLKEFDRVVSQFAHMLERLDIRREDCLRCC
jgi:acetyl-CoA synthetase